MIEKYASNGPLPPDDHAEGYELLVVEGHKYVESSTGLLEIAIPSAISFSFTFKMKSSLWVSLAVSLIGLGPAAARNDYPGNYPSSSPPLGPTDWERTPVSVFAKVLNTQPDPDYNLLKELVTYDCTYISLTFDNPTLHGIMPWAGTHTHVGPQAFIDIFTRVGLYWDRGPFSIDHIFGDDGNVTAWGSFTATSRTLGKTVISPWAARARVNSANQIFEFQWMEDTFTTASSFGSDNSTKVFIANPEGGTAHA